MIYIGDEKLLLLELPAFVLWFKVGILIPLNIKAINAKNIKEKNKVFSNTDHPMYQVYC